MCRASQAYTVLCGLIINLHEHVYLEKHQMNKCLKKYHSIGLTTGLVLFATAAVAHDAGSLAGTPVCIESNIMLADAMNAPFSNIPGPGRVLEMNIFTGERGITVNNSLVPANDNPGNPICDVQGVTCTLPVAGPFGDFSAPWKPTGILSGGENGHSYLTSAAQHLLIEHHRDGTPIRTGPLLPTSPSPNGGGFGFVPRLLGNGFMPNGNIAQSVCDANFFNAPNSDKDANGNLVANSYFPPVNSTPQRGANGRVIVLDQVSLNTIDEYSRPTEGPYANDPRWNCPAGVLFTSEGLFVSMFHGDAVFVIDWKAGIDEASTGVGSNEMDENHPFALGRHKNEAKIIRVIDLSNDGTNNTGYALNYDDSATHYNSGNRRDNLRAIRMSEDGTLWGTRRSRSLPCGVGDAGCNPGAFRQHVFAAAPGSNTRTGSIALDPGVNVLAGVTINRMSGPGCAFVQKEVLDAGGTLTGDECDVETLYLGVSAGNAGCVATGPVPPNPCFTRDASGTMYEYRMDAAHMDAIDGTCTGDPAGDNSGCAMPIAQFKFHDENGNVESLDPRMVMTIHEAFTQ
jgi:hypothetical protein